MNFTFTDDQESLRATVRDFLTKKAPLSQARALIESETGFDPALWHQLTDQLELPGLAIAEEYGGAGYSAVELGIVLEEMGRVLLASPYFATVVLAAQTLTHVGDDWAKAEYLPRIADGSLTATLAITEPSNRWDLDAIETTAVEDTSGWQLTGTKALVVDGASAELVLVIARIGAGIGLFAVDGDAVGLNREELETLDLTRRMATLHFQAVPARPVAQGDVSAKLAGAMDVVFALIAKEQTGAAERCLDMAVEYAKLRVQFGRPIGSFQAIKHKCADMLVRIESAKAAADYATWAASAGSAELPVAAAMAKAYCSEAFTYVAGENIQIHGGIGFTWEHDAHLFLRRAKSSELTFGDPTFHLSRLAGLIGA